MSKIAAYICDNCDTVHLEDEVSGILVTKPDMFRHHYVYDIEMKKLDKCAIHFCTNCYNENVITPTSSISRENDEAGYVNAVKDYTQVFLRKIHIKSIK